MKTLFYTLFYSLLIILNQLRDSTLWPSVSEAKDLASHVTRS